MKSNTPERVVHKTCAVVVKKKPGLHQTFIKSVLEVINLHPIYTWQSHGAGGLWFTVSLSNHGAWECVTSVVIPYADQRGWTHGREERERGDEVGDRSRESDTGAAWDDISGCRAQLSVTADHEFTGCYQCSCLDGIIIDKILNHRNFSSICQFVFFFWVCETKGGVESETGAVQKWHNPTVIDALYVDSFTKACSYTSVCWPRLGKIWSKWQSEWQRCSLWHFTHTYTQTAASMTESAPLAAAAHFCQTESAGDSDRLKSPVAESESDKHDGWLLSR